MDASKRTGLESAPYGRPHVKLEPAVLAVSRVIFISCRLLVDGNIELTPNPRQLADVHLSLTLSVWTLLKAQGNVADFGDFSETERW